MSVPRDGQRQKIVLRTAVGQMSRIDSEQPVALQRCKFKSLFQNCSLDLCPLGCEPALHRKIFRQDIPLELFARPPSLEASPVFRPIERYAFRKVLRPCGHMDLASLRLTNTLPALSMIEYSAANCKGPRDRMTGACGSSERAA